MSTFARSRAGSRRARIVPRVGVVTLFAMLMAGLVACSDDESSVGTTAVSTVPTAPVTTARATTAPATTPPATAATTVATTDATTVATTVATTDATTDATTVPASAPPVTTEPCVAPIGTDTFEDGFPMRMTSLVGVDIRTGAHPCFERVVIELGGTGEMPGVRVSYVDDPVALGPSDQTVDIAGDATLLVAVVAWMPDMEGNGWTGPTQLTPTNVERIVELRQVENFEGMHQWAIGLDEERPFDVALLDSPPRVVIDIATA